MLDGVSLDQLRMFVCVVETGSFSAAGRQLGRAQSVISQGLASLESQLGMPLFYRTGRLPELTPQAKPLLARARDIVRSADSLKAEARAMADGLEPELSVVIDVMFPLGALTDAITAFANAFPATPLRLHVEALGAVAELVLNGRCRVGLMGSMPSVPPDLECVRLLSIPLVTVVSPKSPLAAEKRLLTAADMKGHTQLVLTDRSPLTTGKDYGVLADTVWRLADLGAKHAFLKAGLGWGHMPLPLVRDDLVSGDLVCLDLDTGYGEKTMLPMSAIYRRDSLPGPAGRWLIERLGQYKTCEEIRPL